MNTTYIAVFLYNTFHLWSRITAFQPEDTGADVRILEWSRICQKRHENQFLCTSLSRG